MSTFHMNIAIHFIRARKFSVQYQVAFHPGEVNYNVHGTLILKQWIKIRRQFSSTFKGNLKSII